MDGFDRRRRGGREEGVKSHIGERGGGVKMVVWRGFKMVVGEGA